jgi:hypothetical protein
VNRQEARCRKLLFDVVFQACGQPDGTLDSYALTSYAEAIRVLVDFGYARIETDTGRRVIARLVKWNDEDT